MKDLKVIYGKYTELYKKIRLDITNLIEENKQLISELKKYQTTNKSLLLKLKAKINTQKENKQ